MRESAKGGAAFGGKRTAGNRGVAFGGQADRWQPRGTPGSLGKDFASLLRSALLPTAALAAATISFTVFTRDPEDARSVALVVVAFTILSATLAIRLLGGPAPRRGRGRGVPAAAIRRGTLAGLIAGAFLFLRVIDGLTPLTGGLLILAVAAAEYVLSPRGVRSRR